jgi:hypothetical protein
MPTIKDFAPLYDFSQLEIAAQKVFAAASNFGGYNGINGFIAPPDDTAANRETWTPPAGVIPVFTAYQVAVFTKTNPRISISLDGIVQYSTPAPVIIDANGQLRCRMWRAQLDFTIITPASYSQHVALRTLAQSVIATMVPQINDTLATAENTGLNQFLAVHEVATVIDAGNSTGINVAQGFYASQLKYNITFGIRAAAWPGGFNQ